jgi:FG-GAP repeat
MPLFLNIFFDTNFLIEYIDQYRLRIGGFMIRCFSLRFLFFILAALSFLSAPCSVFSGPIKTIKPVKLIEEFEGTFPGSTAFGDAFGITLSVNKNFFIIGSPGASPNGAEEAGAVYFFRKNALGKWVESQFPFIIPTAFNHLSFDRLVTRGYWLFVAAPGTPLTSPTKDYSGAILVYKYSKEGWRQSQTISNPQGSISGAGEGFGTYLNYAGGNWLIVGGRNNKTVYFYKLNKQSDLWELAQFVNVPDSPNSGTIFVSIDECHALISSVEDSFPTTENGKVYAYRLKDGIWTFVQTLEGDSPPSIYGTGDSFGRCTALEKNWAIIGAPTDNQISDLAGAVYFYHFDEKKKEWSQKQKEFSDLPSVFFGLELAAYKEFAVIGDPGRSVFLPDGTKNIFQGVGVLYKKHPVCWKEGARVWSPIDSVFDPNGRPYDFFGGGGVDIYKHLIGLGTFPTGDLFLPIGFPEKQTNPSINNGRALLFKIKS